MNPEEQLKDKCPECGATAESQVWAEDEPSRDWGTLGIGPRWYCQNCDAYRVIVPWNVNDHQPLRGGEVEAWLQTWRDSFVGQDSVGGGWDARWQVLNEMLDQYRDMADVGVSLAAARERGYLVDGFDGPDS